MTSQENTLHPGIFALFAEQPAPEPKELPPFDLDRLVEQARVRLQQALERSVREHKVEMQARAKRDGTSVLLVSGNGASGDTSGVISIICNSSQVSEPPAFKIRHNTIWFFVVDKEQVPTWLQKFVVTKWITL